jgi:RNA polymerase sigma-70 factor (ECF subfamily)
LSAYPDRQTLEKLHRRDPETITQVVNDHAEVLLKAAWGVGWQGTDAEELVQDTLVTFLKGIAQFEGRSSVRTYLIGILYLKALEKRRSESRQQSMDPIDEVFEKRFGFWGLWCTMPRGPEDEALAKETARLVEDCVAGLPVQQRMAFYLKEVEHESTDNLCKILDVSVTHLGVLLFRARNKLRECVQHKWKEDPS